MNKKMIALILMALVGCDVPVPATTPPLENSLPECKLNTVEIASFHTKDRTYWFEEETLQIPLQADDTLQNTALELRVLACTEDSISLSMNGESFLQQSIHPDPEWQTLQVPLNWTSNNGFEPSYHIEARLNTASTHKRLEFKQVSLIENLKIWISSGTEVPEIIKSSEQQAVIGFKLEQAIEDRAFTLLFSGIAPLGRVECRVASSGDLHYQTRWTEAPTLNKTKEREWVADLESLGRMAFLATSKTNLELSCRTQQGIFFSATLIQTDHNKDLPKKV